MRLYIYFIFFHLISAVSFSQDQDTVSFYVGNVYGTIRDINTSQPISNATIFLLDSTFPVDKLIQLAPEFSSKTGLSDSSGKFLINFVPTEFPFSTYHVLILSPNYQPFILSDVNVYPGASMSLFIDAQLSTDDNMIFSANDPFQPFYYHHEKRFPEIKKLQKKISSDSIIFTVFATREGLVGFTTANGHVILTRDKFVALPSRRSLNSTDQTRQYSVNLKYKGKTTSAPVWDVGPWNTRDDWWNPPFIRQNWSDLSTGLPESQAAYQSGYNNGKDQFNRTVLNSAGIDLADGIFWDDLQLPTNDWVEVEFPWRLQSVAGDSVQAVSSVNIRDSVGGNKIGEALQNQIGVILEGPKGGSYGSTFYIWWKIKWSESLIGWSVEPFLTNKFTSQPEHENPISSAVELYQNFPNPFSSSTTINYNLKSDSFVSIKIFDVLGKEIKTLVNQNQTKGPNSVIFNASSFSSGIYYCIVRVNSTVNSIKITLIK